MAVNKAAAFPACICLALVLVLGATACFEWWQNGSPMTNNQNSVQRSITYALLLLFGALGVAKDWYELGPTVALKQGAVSAITAWVLVVPFGFISEFLVELTWFWLFVGAGICSLCAATSLLECPWSGLLGLGGLATCVWLALRYTVDISHTFGTVVLFVVVYGIVHLCLGESSAAIEPVETWEGDWGHCEKVEEDTSEYRHRLADFNKGCEEYASKYNFGLEMKALYRISRDQESSAARLVRTADGQRLFHGTSRVAALGIVNDGFRLPDHRGMFGKGIYFAKCPLKSWQYTDGRPWRSGVMLMCWVELGRAHQAGQAKPELTRPPRRSFFEWVTRKPKYESVIGLDTDAGGALRVPEYIVYDPAKVEVDYVLEVQNTLLARG